MLSISMAACSDDGDSGDGGSGSGNDGGTQGGEGSTDQGLKYYTVSVENYKGEPVAGVIVRLLDASGNQFKAQPVGVSGEKIDGRADFTDVTSGSYTVALLSTVPGKTLKYSNVTVNEANKHVTVLVYDLLSEKNYPIYGNSIPENSFAYTANGSGGYSLDTVSGITYLIFFADEKGVFELSVDDGKIGYFGNPINVFDNPIQSDSDMFFVLSDDKIKIEIPDVNTPYVIGIESETAGSAVFKASKVSGLPNRPIYDECVNVTAKASLSQYTLDTSRFNLVDVDVKSRSLSVTLGDDGYYYTNDGKLVVIRINSASPYIDSIALMAGLINENIGGSILGYIYDEEGNYLRKELYNDMIASYSAVADEATGVYPLTEEMANAIRIVGEFRGWWSDGGANIFDEQTKPLVNKDIAWLLMCAYLEEK
jgi:hypothetical protein